MTHGDSRPSVKEMRIVEIFGSVCPGFFAVFLSPSLPGVTGSLFLAFPLPPALPSLSLLCGEQSYRGNSPSPSPLKKQTNKQSNL